MLRDVPRLYAMIFFIGAILVLMTIWFTNNFHRGSDTLQLNEVILSSAVTEVDHQSRLYEGALLLADTFESSVWESIEAHYPEGSAVQFDYLFDTDDDRFDAVETEPVSSPTYYIGGEEGDIPSPDTATYMTGRPVEVVRVKVNEKGDNVGDWTYTATVTVDSASKSED